MANTKIYNMASNDVTVTAYQARKEGEVTGENKIANAIVIKGKANVRDPKTGVTPKWSVTEVNEEQLKLLKASKPFMRKVDRGYITIGKEPESFKADKSAQLTEESKEVKSAKAKGAAVKTNTDSDE